MKKKISNDEIDLSDIIFRFWDNKFKILVITTAFIIMGFLYYNFLNKSFSASTNIKPISTFENQKYKMYNTYAGEGVLNFDSKSLFNIFIDKIQIGEIIEKGIIKSKLINKDSFKNEESYEEEVKRIAILIIDQMTRPSVNKDDEIKSVRYWQYNFNVSDKVKWRNFLEYVDKNANEEIRQSLISQFNSNLDILIKSSKFKLEDIDQNIKNALDDYKISTSNRLVFLKEQAEIARTLDIAKNTLEAENFQSDNTIVTNIKPDSSYYLKGYEMIEKEISLINSRTNKKAFIENIVKLEQEKRFILQDKKIERLKFSFSKTPIHNKNEFIAGKIDYLATVYTSDQSLVRVLSISLIIGLLLSFMFVLINNVISSRK